MLEHYKIAQGLSNRYAPSNQTLSLHAKREQFLSSSIIPSDTFAFSGIGAEITTNNGLLLDLGSMTVNCILGQNDPWVNANIIAYTLSDQPSFLTTRIGGSLYYEVADRLLHLTGRTDGFINHRQSNGSDTTELAIIAAYNNRLPEQTKLISFKGSYHGQGLTASYSSHLQTKHRFLVDNDSPVIFLEQPNNASSMTNTTPLSDHDSAILDDVSRLASDAFAVIIEPIQVNSSVNMPSRAFMQTLNKICSENGIALIFDEVQTGCGWLGSMTAAEQYGVKPSLFALSKALTAGYGPLSALIGDKKYKDLKEGSAAKTNGADIRSLVAANAVMDRLFGVADELIPKDAPEKLQVELRDGLLSKFDLLSSQLSAHLDNVASTYPNLVLDIKGEGLIRGIQFSHSKNNIEDVVHSLQERLLKNGVLVRHSKDTLIIKPPLVIETHQMDAAFEIIINTMKEYA
ncbi:MAG TPA: aminotransferase class III-fold pyridoxal phosphate-dependent enzyme [Candidatus Saccharimonadales bacterium]